MRSDEDEDEDEYTRRMAQKALPLAGLPGGGIQDGSVLTIMDFSQDMRLTMGVVHREQADFDELVHPQVRPRGVRCAYFGVFTARCAPLCAHRSSLSWWVHRKPPRPRRS